MFPSGSLQVFFLASCRRRIEFCVVIHTNAAQFLCEIPSKLPLCECSERELWLSEVLHETLCTGTASFPEDGVTQRVTFSDGHTVTRVHHDVRRASRNERTLCVDMCMASTLNVSNLVCAICCLLVFVFRGDSMDKAGCSSSATLSSLYKVFFQIFFMSVQFVTIPRSISNRGSRAQGRPACVSRPGLAAINFFSQDEPAVHLCVN